VVAVHAGMQVSAAPLAQLSSSRLPAQPYPGRPTPKAVLHLLFLSARPLLSMLQPRFAAALRDPASVPCPGRFPASGPSSGPSPIPAICLNVEAWQDRSILAGIHPFSSLARHSRVSSDSSETPTRVTPPWTVIARIPRGPGRPDAREAPLAASSSRESRASGESLRRRGSSPYVPEKSLLFYACWGRSRP
jgi:hypothetical protein